MHRTTALKRPIVWIPIPLGLCFAAALLFFAGRGTTPAIRDDAGTPLSGSVALLEKVELGGMDQWILIRGQDSSNPILLWLHGGPGAPLMPVARHFIGGLEQDFVVVHWDQRGAGKSNPPDFDEGTMTFRQFFNDAHELTQYLKKRFHRASIYLVGHSWGTQLGLRLAEAYPEDYCAYVGISQVVDPERAFRVSRTWLLERIRESGDSRAEERLKEIGPALNEDHEAFVRYINMIHTYGGDLDLSMARLLWIAVRAPEYRINDLFAWLRGANRGSGPMWRSPEYQSYNAIKQVPRLTVPAYFFCGRDDYNTPLEVTREYFEILEAPNGKELVVFEESAHTPFMAEPEKFNAELLNVKRDTSQ